MNARGGMAEAVDTLVLGDQGARSNAALDNALLHAGTEQLSAGDQTLLPIGELLRCPEKTPYTEVTSGQRPILPLYCCCCSSAARVLELQRRGWDSNPRGSFHRPHDFQSCTLSHSVTSPRALKILRDGRLQAWPGTRLRPGQRKGPKSRHAAKDPGPFLSYLAQRSNKNQPRSPSWGSAGKEGRIR